MDSPEQRRKRKRNLKPTRLIPPVKSLVYFFFFFVFFYLLFKRHTVALNDVVLSSSLKSLSITSFTTSSHKALTNFDKFSIQARVSFPDHVLLLVKKLDVGLGSDRVEFGVENGLECVYRRNGTGGQRGVDRLNVLSVDEYTDDRLIVRCPLLGNGRNFTEVIGLRRRGLMVRVGDDKTNSWENLAYEAVLDGNTAVVFVKGISHRQDKESDPNQFSCHFGLGDWESGGGGDGDGKYMLTTRFVAETAWIRNLLRELHSPLSTATLVYCDNVSAVYMSANPVQHQRTKHIEIDIHFVRDMVTAGQVRVLHVPSRYQYADIFTKGLPSTLFEEFRSSLSVRCPPASTAGEC